MYAGQLLESGRVEEIFSKPKHPYTYTIKLLGSVPRLDMDRTKSLHSIEGTPPDLYIPPKGCPFFDRCDKAMVICKDHMPEREFHTELGKLLAP